MFDRGGGLNPVHSQRASPVLLGFTTGGLEIPCTLEFVSHKENEAAKAESFCTLAVPATNLKKAVPAPHLKKLSAGDVVDLVVDDEEKSPPTKKPNYIRHGNQPHPTVIESKASKF